jgi:hypothetical protein
LLSASEGVIIMTIDIPHKIQQSRDGYAWTHHFRIDAAHREPWHLASSNRSLIGTPWTFRLTS